MTLRERENPGRDEEDGLEDPLLLVRHSHIESARDLRVAKMSKQHTAPLRVRVEIFGREIDPPNLD